MALAIVFNASALAAVLLTLQFWVTRGLSAATATPPSLAIIPYLAVVAALALPVALVLGVQRARLATLPDEVQLALAPRQAFAYSQSAIRRAIYRTALHIAFIPLSLISLNPTLGMFAQVWLGTTATTKQLDESFPWIYTAHFLLVNLGYWFCLLEWQVLLASRFPAQTRHAWLLALPYGTIICSWAIGTVIILIAYPHGMALSDFPRGYDWYGLALLVTLLCLLLAPLLWRWAAAAHSETRWLAVAAVCLAGICGPRFYIEPAEPLVHPALVIATAAGTGLSLSINRYPLLGRGLYPDNPVHYDVISLARAKIATGQNPPHEPSNLLPHDQAKELKNYLQPYRLTGAGVQLTHNLFLPWPLAQFCVIIYYLYCYIVLRNASSIYPVRTG